MKTIKGHITATEKKAIKAIFNAGLMAGKVGRKEYHISQQNEVYTVKIIENGRDLGFIGSPLQQETSIKQFTW